MFDNQSCPLPLLCIYMSSYSVPVSKLTSHLKKEVFFEVIDSQSFQNSVQVEKYETENSSLRHF